MAGGKPVTELLLQSRGKVDGGLTDWQLDSWLDVVRFGMYLNVELVTFPDGLNVSCKRKRNGELA